MVTVRTALRGSELLHDPLLNKGTAFTDEERERFGLTGLLPDHVSTLDEQVRRAYRAICRKEDLLERYIGLAALQDRNEHLFYRLLLDHTEELLPVIYTPTVGLAAQRFSHIFRKARGLWITPEHRGRIAAVLRNSPRKDVSLIVATDNERILGLGDQGAGGMTIPVGKLALYTLGAGIHPARCLPVSLDVGTDNNELLEDELYLGWRQPRLRGDAYDELIEEFVTAVQSVFPRALLQWEDFKKANAFRLLERYRGRLLSFNDDIQGTAAVGLAGMLAGVRAIGQPLGDQRVLILGAGAAGVGIAGQLRIAFERSGLSDEQARRRIALVDSRGLVTVGRGALEGDEFKLPFAWPDDFLERWGLTGIGQPGLEEMVETFRPTALYGTTGQSGIFSERLIRRMADQVERPMVFPFSNPTSKAEARPADVLRWTGGRALVATGSPFEPVELDGRAIRIGQGNNVFIFPGIGLGALAAGASEIPDRLFTTAAEELARTVRAEELARGSLYPRLGELRRVTVRIAEAVARELGFADEGLGERIQESMWVPEYPRLES